MPRLLWSLAVLFAWKVRGSYITQASLSVALSFGRREREIARSLVRKLVDKGLAHTAMTGSRGRKVFDTPELRNEAELATTWLHEHGQANYARGLGLPLVPPSQDKRPRERADGDSDSSNSSDSSDSSDSEDDEVSAVPAAKRHRQRHKGVA